MAYFFLCIVLIIILALLMNRFQYRKLGGLRIFKKRPPSTPLSQEPSNPDPSNSVVSRGSPNQNRDYLDVLKSEVRERDRIWFDTRDNRPNLQPELKPSSSSSIEDLIKSLGCGNNSEFRRLAAELLGQRSQTATPAISALLIASVDVNATVRTAALNALESIDPGWPQNPEAKKAFPKLMEEFKHSYCFKKSYSEDVSRAAYKLLQKIGEPIVPLLANLIVEEEDKVEYKIYAIWILRDLGLGAASAMPQLIQSLNHKVAKVRISAAEVLANLGTTATAATPEIILGLADRDEDVRKAMVTCLLATEPTMPTLLPLLVSKHYNIRESVANALVKNGSQTLKVLLEMVLLWCSKPKAGINNFEKYQEITEAISNIPEKSDPETTETALQLQKNCGQEITVAALQVLGKFGSNASVAMPTISLALVDPNPHIKFAAVRALGKIDRNWVSNPVVFNTVACLASTEVIVLKLVSDLTNLSSVDANNDDIGSVVACVAQFGAAAEPAVPTLLQLLESWHFDLSLRRDIIDALVQIGAGAKAAIPVLTKISNDEDVDNWFRSAATNALLKINGRPNENEMGFRW
jgi:HEAT repeat protein